MNAIKALALNGQNTFFVNAAVTRGTGAAERVPLHQVGCLPLCKAVLAGDDPLHFTLPLVEVKTRKIAGYVHATWLCTMDASLRKLVMSRFVQQGRGL